MATTFVPMTAAELAIMPNDCHRYELIRGELIQKPPAGREHGNIGFNFSLAFGQFVKTHRLGEVYLAETGFILCRDPDTVRAPDCAFIRSDRLPEIDGVTGYIPIAPDLAVEVVSPNDRLTEINEKTLQWLNFGVRVVVVIDPRKSQVKVIRPSCPPVILTRDDILTLPDIVAGWSLDLSDLFH